MRAALDKDAQDALICTHLPLIGYEVSDIARRIPAHVRREDLASAGALALVQAGRSFDPALGVPFARYASRRIRGAIIDELRAMDWAPRAVRRQAKNASEARDVLTATLHREPTRDELAHVLGIEPAALDAVAVDEGRRVLSLDAPVASGVMEVAASDLGPEDRALVVERLRYLNAAVTELPQRLRVVVEGLFLHDRSAAELAAELAVTPSRISQMRSEALQMLGDALRLAFEQAPNPRAYADLSAPARRLHAYYAAVAQRAASQRAPLPVGRQATSSRRGPGPGPRRPSPPDRQVLTSRPGVRPAAARAAGPSAVAAQEW